MKVFRHQGYPTVPHVPATRGSATLVVTHLVAQPAVGAALRTEEAVLRGTLAAAVSPRRAAPGGAVHTIGEIEIATTDIARLVT